MKKITPIALLILFLSSCASFYQPFTPRDLEYINFKLGDKISYSYTSEVLTHNKNRKYARKYYFEGIAMYSVKIKNNTDLNLNVNKDLMFSMNGKEVYPLDSDLLFKDIKQSLGWYAFYCIIGIPAGNVFLPIGAGIGIGNAIVAHKSNKKYRKNIIESNLVHSIIPANETVYGIVAIKHNLKLLGELEITVRE